MGKIILDIISFVLFFVRQRIKKGKANASKMRDAALIEWHKWKVGYEQRRADEIRRATVRDSVDDLVRDEHKKEKKGSDAGV